MLISFCFVTRKGASRAEWMKTVSFDPRIPTMFRKILIANRGEIACRVIKTARHLGIQTVAVYSEADRGALHVRMADEAVCIGGTAASESYLRADAILKAARDTGAEAVHPGYGFLSENTDFARACAKAGIKFIGPSAAAIDAMGLKDKAKDIMEKAGVPVVPGYRGAAQDEKTLAAAAADIGYPVLIKAVAGGGGKGMRLVRDAKEFSGMLQSCQREASASFGNDRVLIEKYIACPRHVEVQVFGDSKGNAVHLFERDCSLQRRHQKVVEEAPAPGLRDDVRDALGAAAIKAVKALKYENAGTIEFIMDGKTQDFFFMEMNTRLQVEHPVTEMVTGLDLVEWQLRVAYGEEIPLQQKDIMLRGHAFEVRLYAEDPAQGFLPQTGRVEAFVMPDHARIDSGVEAGDTVSIHYDPMIAKLIVHGDNRSAAIEQMQHALQGIAIAGLNNNHEFLTRVFAQHDFINGDVDTDFIARHESFLIPDDYGLPHAEDLALACIYFGVAGADELSPDDPWSLPDSWRMDGATPFRRMSFLCRGTRFDARFAAKGTDFELDYNGHTHNISWRGGQGAFVRVLFDGRDISAAFLPHGDELSVLRAGRVVMLHCFVHGADDDGAAGEGRITTPMPGRIIDVMVRQGDHVEKDQPLLIMEAMKMEMTIRAGCAGVVDELPVAVNDQVADGALLVSIKDSEA